MSVRLTTKEGAFQPFRHDDNYSMFELRTPVRIRVMHGSSNVLDTKLQIIIPEGHLGLVSPVHDLVKSCGVLVHDTYTEGVYDIVLRLYNVGDNDVFLNPGDVVANLIVVPVSRINTYLV